MQWNFHVEENIINVKFEITYFDCEVLERIIEWKYVCLTFEKRNFTKKIETYTDLFVFEYI